MRIAFIVDTFPSVSETFILNQITGLMDLGHEVTIFTGKPSGLKDLPPDVSKYGLMDRTYCINRKPGSIVKRYLQALTGCLTDPVWTLRSFDPFKYGKEAFSLNVFFKSRNFRSAGDFDIVQCHFGTNGNVGALLKEAGINFKLVTMFHGYDIRKALSREESIYSRLIEEGDCFLSISDYTRGNLIALGFPEKKILYHPVGIDLSKFTFRIRKLETGERSCIRIITVARLVKEKGLDLGISAFYLVKKRFPDIDLEYVIAGGGPLLEGLKETADSIGLEDSVSFAGVCSHEKVSDLLNGSDIFLLPSIAEALPVSLIEAQASGLPVVAAKVGSVDQTFLEGKSGYLAKPQDVSDIAARLADLISDHEKWPIMSVAGRKFVEERYDIKKLNKKLESIYKRLMKE